MKKFFVIPLLALLALAGCAYGETRPNEVAVVAADGPLSAETIQEDCIGPSTRQGIDVNGKTYNYWNDQRSWDFTGGDQSEAGPVSVTDKDGVTLQVPGTLTFTLNTNCDVLKDFHTRIGIKYKSWENDGWAQTLRLYVGQPLEKAMDQASQKYTWRQLLQDTTIRDAWEDEVGALARRFAADQAGGEKDYFCSPSYTGDGECGDFLLQLQKPILPEQVANALAETAAEVERQAQARAAQDRVNVEAVTLQALTDVLGPEMAVIYMAMQDGEIQVMPVPFGSAFNIAPPTAE